MSSGKGSHQVLSRSSLSSTSPLFFVRHAVEPRGNTVGGSLALALSDLILGFLYSLIVYGVIATIIVTVFQELVGPNIRLKIRRGKRRLMKWVRNYPFNITVTIKNNQISLPYEEASGKISEMFNDADIKFGSQNSSFHFTLQTQKKDVLEGELSFSPPSDENADSIQIRFVYPAHYRGFPNDYIDTIDLVHSMEKMVRKYFPQAEDWSEVLECSGLKGAFETTGILSSQGLQALSTTKDNITLDFFQDKITLYGQLNSQLKDLLQELVAYYG